MPRRYLIPLWVVAVVLLFGWRCGSAVFLSLEIDIGLNVLDFPVDSILEAVHGLVYFVYFLYTWLPVPAWVQMIMHKL